MCVLRFLMAFLFLLVLREIAVADDRPDGRVYVQAKCNGHSDDTDEFRKAIEIAGKSAGVVFVPPGRCVISDTLVVTGDKPVSIIGVGRSSQVYMRENKTLIHYTGVNAISVRDLYLGSSATAPGTSLLKLTNSHHNRIDNVTMLGSNIGLHFEGSLLNTIVDLRSGTNFQGFFAPTSVNVQWVLAERFNNVSANANTFVAPVLEGGTNGVVIRDPPGPSCLGCIRNGEGSVQITGGSIEGVAQTALHLDRTFLPTSVTGVHFEANGVDVLISDSANIRLTAVLSVDAPATNGKRGILISGTNNGQFTRNIQVSDSIAQEIFIDTNVRRVQLQNITTDLNCTSVSGIFPPTPADPSIIYTNVGLNCT